MASYTIRNALGAGVTSSKFFQTGEGGSLLGFSDNAINVQNPDGTIIAIVGTGFVLTDIGGGEMVPTAGTIANITLYQADFATQMAGFADLSVPAVDFYNAWQVSLGNVFNFLLSGNDTVNGSAFNDSLFGAAGNDTINGFAGDDYIEPGRGTDTVDGGDGTRDILSYANANGDATVTKGVTVDLSKATVTDAWGDTDSFSGIEGVRGTNFADMLAGNAADNRFEPLGGADVVDGGAGIDQIRYNRDAQYGGALGVVVNLATGTGTDGFGKTDSFTNIEAVVGTELADTLNGGNLLLPNGASYEAYGLGGDDTIIAGAWDLYAEPGAGNDKITGGGGADQVSYAEYTGTKGATFDLTKNTVSDPYGGTDSLFGSIEGVRGTRNADTIIGNSLNNFVRGLAGNDSINGGAGNDQVRYDRDAQYGGTKGVTVNLATGIAIDGFGDTDTLVSIENIRGSAQADTLTGDGTANLLQGMAGDDTLDGGSGSDTADYSADAFFGGSAGVTVNLATGTATDGFGNTDTLIAIETVRGTAGKDTLIGGNTPLGGTDVYTLSGLDGDDTLTAGSFDTLFNPGAGNDVVTGGAGNDQVSYEEYTGANGAVINLATGVVADPFGGTDTLTSVEGVRGTRNADTITGTGGSNFIRGLGGNDTIDGGGGTDEVRYDRDTFAGGNGNIFVDLAAGKATDGFGATDTLISIENMRGSQNNDDLRGDANNNRIQPMGGADFIDGRGGQDVVDYSFETLPVGVAGVTINLASGKATDLAGFVDELVSIEAGRGSVGNDTLIGGDAALVGQSYEIYGMAGDDTITAGSFDTYIEPGAGSDSITGGAGFDQVSYSEYNGASGIDANLGTGIVLDPYGGKDTLSGSIEMLRGTRNADVLIGNNGNNQFRGLNGSDFINGGAGLDRVRYDRDAQFGGSKGVVVDVGKGTATDGFGNADTLISIEQVEGTAFADTLTGGDTNLGPGTSYELYGRGGDDILIGGAYSVYIEPGAGNDTVTGGSGAADQIGYADFTNGVGITLDLSKGSVVDPLGGTDSFTGIENVRGTNSADTITGDAGANQITGLRGADTLDGGTGIDMVRYDRDANYGGKAAVTVNLALGTATDGFGDTDTLQGFETVRGSNALAGDTLTGDGNNNRFQGLNGADVIDGAGGIDTVDYTRDISDGGAAGVTVNLGSAGLGKGSATDGFGSVDTLMGIENVIGTEVADTLTGDGSANVLQGGLGDDIIDGAGGEDVAVFSGASSTYVVAIGPGGVVTVTGADGKDTLTNIEQLKFSDTTIPLQSTFSIAPTSTSLAEGTGSGSTDFTFKITRTGNSTLAQSIGWSTAGATGSGSQPAAATDFVGNAFPSGTASFAAGETSRTITVPVLRDAVGEFNERFAVTLGTAPGGATIGTGSAQAVILNDDTSYQVNAGPSGVEPTGGTLTFSFTVSRTGTLTSAGSVGFKVEGFGVTPADTADFVGGVMPSGSLSFAAGETSKTVQVQVVGDSVQEANETFRLVLSNPVGGGIAFGGVSERVLFNDDTSFSIAATSASKPEGTGGAGATTPFTFTVTRAGEGGIAQNVAWAVAGVTGNGTQPADAADFAGGVLPSGVLSFAVGEKTQTVTVNVAADAVGELAERFAVTLSGPTNGATLGAANAQGVIQNDDTSLRVVASGAMSQAEGNVGSRSYSFVVQRQGTTTGASTVNYAVTGTGAAPATGADFVGGVLPTGTVSFAAGQTSQTVTVNVAGDTAQEADEGFRFSLSSPVGATITVPSLDAVILSDDSTLSIAATSANKPEGSNAAPGATTPFTFTIARTGATGVAQSVNWSVAGVAGSGTVPADAADFGGVLPSGTVTFAAGDTTSRVITVPVAADLLGESNERFGVTLSSPTNGAQINTDPTKASAQGIIQNDDTSLRVLAGGNLRQAEGNAGPRAFVFTVQRQGTTTGVSTVNFAVTGLVGDPLADPADAADFTGGVLPSGTLTFAANEVIKTVTVNVAGDTVFEDDELFELTLANATGAAISIPSQRGIILTDESTVSIAAVAASRAEGSGPAGATSAFTFSVTRTGGTNVAQTVGFSVAGETGGGTAPATAADFANGVFPTGTISFTEGQVSRTVTINVRADETQEVNERFAVTLANPTGGAVIGTASAQGVILNDDFVSTAANQTLTGSAAPDLFLLGGGLDTVTGNAGLDSFRFLQAAIGTGATNATTIQDFNPGLGEKLDLSAIDAIAGTLANDSFTFNPTQGAGFSGAGSLVWALDGTRVSILGDTNGDFAADLTIFVRPVGTPDASWFVL